MPASWGWFEYLAAALLVGIPLLALVGQLRAWLRDSSAARRIERAGERRQALRTPTPGSVALEGEVEVQAHPAVIVMRRQHGCLGGPLVFEVAEVLLRGDDGSHFSVALGPDPNVRGTELLSSVVSSPSGPLPTGAPDLFALTGRVRIEGVQPTASGGFAPPNGYSALLTVLGPPRH